MISKNTYVTIILCLLFSSFSYAKDENTTPRLPENKEQGQLQGVDEVIDETVVAKTDDQQQILIEKIKGLVFLSEQQQVKLSRSEVTGIDVKAMTSVKASGLIELLKDYLGNPLSLAILNQINQQVSLHFRKQGYTVVDSIVPTNQDITEGVIQFVVLIGRMGKLTVEGGEYFSADRVRQTFVQKEGELLQTNLLKDDLNWLNKNPFRTVDLILESGEKIGQTDVNLTINDIKPYRYYVGLEDTGSDTTGENRLVLGANMGNLFNLEHQLNYQYSRSLDGEYLQAHALSYIVPFDWRHTLTVSLSDTSSIPKSSLTGFNLEGKSNDFSLDYSVPLKNKDTWKHDISYALELKSNNNNLEFGQNNVFDKTTEIAQLVVNYNASFPMDNASNSLSVSLVVSPGGASSKNDDENFIESREGARAQYEYLTAYLKHIRPLENNALWLSEFKLQLSTKNLLGSEQMGAGGSATVRGYDEFSVVGDQGLLLKTEWQSKWKPLFAPMTSSINKDQYKWLAFLEGAIVENVDEIADESSISIASAGIGVRYQLEDYLTLRMDYGWQLKELDTQDQNGRFHFGLMASF